MENVDYNATKSLTRFVCKEINSYLLFKYKHFSGVSIVDFEQVNAN